jgi:hypothetical protein
MRNDTDDEYQKRFPPTDFESGIVVTRHNFRMLGEALRSSDPTVSTLAAVASGTEELLLHLPIDSDLVTSSTGVITHCLPRKNDVLHVLGAMPNLKTLTIQQRDGEDEQGPDWDINNIFVDSREPESVIFPALADLKANPPRLRSLNLIDHTFNGKDLIKLLTAHISLRTIHLESITLTGPLDTPPTKWVAWRNIYLALLNTKIKELTLDGLTDPKHSYPNVLLERADNDDHQWSSEETPDPNVDLDDVEDYAAFTRYAATLKGSWVRKGLEMLLGRTVGVDYTLYEDVVVGEE